MRLNEILLSYQLGATVANNLLLSLVLLYLHMHLIPHDLGCRAMARWNIFCVECYVIFFPSCPPSPPTFHCFLV